MDTLTSMQTMRYLRSYRFFLILCFTLGSVVFIYRFHSINNKSRRLSWNILTKRIDTRLQYLNEYFAHVNISMLLDRPVSDRSPSITYRCREWCGGCKCIHFISMTIIYIQQLTGGDRLRGITSTFILAVLTRRRFYIDMPYPCELTKYLKPNLYDWKVIPLG